MDITEMKEKLISAISSLVDGKINKLEKKMTTVVKGLVISNDGMTKYTVSINNKTYTARSHLSYKVNDVVWIVVANGDYKNLFILY